MNISRGTLKMANMVAQSDANGVAVLKIKCPGTPGDPYNRIIIGGKVWFDNPTLGDKVEAYVTDEDDILGHGAGTILGGYTETECDENQRGWEICMHDKTIEVRAMTGEGRLRPGFYLKLVVSKGSAVVDTARCNLYWSNPNEL